MGAIDVTGLDIVIESLELQTKYTEQEAKLLADQARAEHDRLAAEAEQLRQENEGLDETMKQRDAAEEALGRAYTLVTGRAPEWSSSWHYQDALDEISEAVAAFEEAAGDG